MNSKKRIQDSKDCVAGAPSTGGLQKWNEPHPPPGSDQHISVRRTEVVGGGEGRTLVISWWKRQAQLRPLEQHCPLILQPVGLCRALGPLTTDLWLVQSANLYLLWLCFYSIPSPRAGFIPQTYKSVRGWYITREGFPR